MEILYEDNHLIIINKAPGEIVQGDKTGDEPVSEKLKAFLKEKYHKPGNVFVGVVHRLDRPVSGAVIFAKTSKALSRMNALVADKDKVTKTYWAIVEKSPALPEGKAVHWLKRNEAQNKSYVTAPHAPGAKEALLEYRTLFTGDHYILLEVRLLTGRHHQIRAQLAALGSPIKGDLKYGAKRSNAGGSISLHARELTFVHPVSKSIISVMAPFPPGSDELFGKFAKEIERLDDRPFQVR